MMMLWRSPGSGARAAARGDLSPGTFQRIVSVPYDDGGHRTEDNINGKRPTVGDH
jgi:hypothetical protein